MEENDNQIWFEKYRPKKLADIIISNDGSLQELEEKVKKIHQDLEREILK